MAKGNVSPRQKMINLMYLVFIAMLAMQIDREVLRSFQGINESLVQSADLTEENNIIYFKDLAEKAQTDPSQYATRNEKAQELRSASNDMVEYINQLKDKLGASDIGTGENTDYNALQATEPIMDLFFKGDGGKDEQGNSVGQDFVAKLNSYVSKVKSIAGAQGKSYIDKTFDFKGQEGNTWLKTTFYEQPVVASLSNLSKIQSDIRTVEGNIVRELLATQPKDIVINAFQPIPVTPGVVGRGKPANLEVFVGTYANSVTGTVSAVGQTVKVSNGKATIALNTGNIGVYPISGTMTYMADGKPVTESFSTTYQVVDEIKPESIAKPKDVAVGVVTADKMNVVYRGLPNPISANMSGAVPGSVNLTASTGSLSKTGQGKYIYTPGGGGEVTFTVSGKSYSGSQASTQYKFRIKNIPPAQGQVRGQNALAMPASSLGNSTVTAAIPDFLFDVNITVTGFKVKVPGKRTITCSGNRFSSAAAAAINEARGDVCAIFDITATANNGVKVNSVSPVLVSLQ